MIRRLLARLFVRRMPLQSTPRSAWTDVVTDRQFDKQTNVRTRPVQHLSPIDLDLAVDVQPLRKNP